MDSIKHKMEALVKEKDDQSSIADKLEADKSQLTEKCSGFEKNITENERFINTLEGQLDDCITGTDACHEKLDEATKIASDAELEVSALVRRIQLLEEETTRVNDRLTEIMEKLPNVEKSLEDNERQRKILEAKSFQNEEKTELQDTQLLDATNIAKDAEQKCDEVMRKLRMVEGDLERVVDRAEEFEKKMHDYESTLEVDRKRLKELEDQASANGLAEDTYEDQVRKLSEDLKNQETRAEFGERTVDKLEGTIDYLTDQLYQEKVAYRDMSQKLDTTLKDMMGL